jgi:hypothetical protein
MRCRTREPRRILRRAMILGAAAVALFSVPASGQLAEPMTQDAAAKKALDALSQLVTDANFSAMGFQTREEARRATLGKPIARRLVAYDRLVKSAPDVAITALLEPTEQAVYPVTVGDAVRTSILLTRVGERWQISSIGDASLALLLREAGQLGAADVQIVSVPGLNFDFLGVGQGPEMLLVPAMDYPEIHQTRGRRVPATEVVAVLVAYAKDFDQKYGEQLRQRRLVM